MSMVRTLPLLRGTGKLCSGMSLKWRQGGASLVSQNKQGSSLCRAPEAKALLLPIVGLCPMFQMCWRPCGAVPGSWEQTRAQLSVPKLSSLVYCVGHTESVCPQTLQSVYCVGESFPPLSSTQLRPCLTFPANLAGPWRTGNLGTALQLGPGFANFGV